MFQNIHEQFEVFSCIIEIETDNKVQKQNIQQPRIMLEQNFASLIQQAANTSSPTKVKISRVIPVYDCFNSKWIEREIDIVFKNNAYLAAKGEENL